MQIGQPGDPLQLRALARQQMDVAEVEDRERAAPRPQHRHLHTPQGVHPCLGQRIGAHSSSEAGQGDQPRGNSTANAHGFFVGWPLPGFCVVAGWVAGAFVVGAFVTGAFVVGAFVAGAFVVGAVVFGGEVGLGAAPAETCR